MNSNIFCSLTETTEVELRKTAKAYREKLGLDTLFEAYRCGLITEDEFWKAAEKRYNFKKP